MMEVSEFWMWIEFVQLTRGWKSSITKVKDKYGLGFAYMYVYLHFIYVCVSITEPATILKIVTILFHISSK